MRIWRLIVVVMGVMIVTGALGAGVGGLIAFAMPETTAAIINARPDRWLGPLPAPHDPNPDISNSSKAPDPGTSTPAKVEVHKSESEIPPSSYRIPIMPIDERIARAAALAGALSLPLGGLLGLLLAILDQFMVYSRTAMSMVGGSGVRRVSTTTKFTPPPPVNL
jgi:hypothetical protein